MLLAILIIIVIGTFGVVICSFIGTIEKNKYSKCSDKQMNILNETVEKINKAINKENTEVVAIDIDGSIESNKEEINEKVEEIRKSDGYDPLYDIINISNEIMQRKG